MRVHELNIDGLVGPTHNYAGLAPGNIASEMHALNIANPQLAALQGLEKMRLLHNMGLKQALFPPQQRPNLRLLHQLGFTGSPDTQITNAQKNAPQLLSACYSASSMWAANTATVSASLDCYDNRVHFTAANLITNLHRHQEADFSKYLLEKIFNNNKYFQHHDILPRSVITADEGAANHNRLCAKHNKPGVNLFVYGKQALKSHDEMSGPIKCPARQTYEASNAIARSHGLNFDQVIFACQRPEVIDQGVFHNDVIAVANESTLLIHEHAFVNQQQVFNELQEKADFAINIITVMNEQVSVADAVSTYLFNSQLLSLADGSMVLVAPWECNQNQRVKAFIEQLLSDNNNPISQVHFLDLKQSMHNGGGPACLRLRVPLNEHELEAMHQGILVTDQLLTRLEEWVKKHYRTELRPKDLADPMLIHESLFALDRLSNILDLRSIYPFQQEILR